MIIRISSDAFFIHDIKGETWRKSFVLRLHEVKIVQYTGKVLSVGAYLL